MTKKGLNSHLVTALMVGWALLGVDAWAGTFLVDSVSDQVDAAPGDGECVTSLGSCTLRAAVEEANAIGGSHQVMLSPGTYVLSTGQGIPIAVDLELTGDGPATTIIDGNNTVRIFDAAPGISLNLTGMTVQAGQTLGDGGLVRAHGPLTITNAWLKGGVAAGRGGAIYQTGGALLLTDVLVEESTAAQGGGLYRTDLEASAVLERVILQGNVANEGAGLYSEGRLTFTGGEIIANRADIRGGGIFSTDDLTIEESNIGENQAGDIGGAGIYQVTGNLSVKTSRIHDNQVDGNYGDGAGVFAGPGTVLVLDSSALFGNRMSSSPSLGRTRGGGLYFEGAELDALNVTVSGNEAEEGGGIFAAQGRLTLRNVTLAFNSAAVGANVKVDGSQVDLLNTLVAEPSIGSSCAGTVSSLGHNLDSDGSCALVSDGDISGAWAGLGDLDTASGTHALLAGSAAIDAGAAMDCPFFDGIGLVRTDGACDIGAREAGAVPADGGTLYFETAQSTHLESANVVSVGVVREGGNLPVTLTYTTTDDTAYSGVDYLPNEGELTWSEQDHSIKYIEVSLLDNDEYQESSRQFFLVLSKAGGGARLVEPGQHTLTIEDDDLPPSGDPDPTEPPPDEETPVVPPDDEELECIRPVGQGNCPPKIPPGLLKKFGGGAQEPWFLILLLGIYALRRFKYRV